MQTIRVDLPFATLAGLVMATACSNDDPPTPAPFDKSGYVHFDPADLQWAPAVAEEPTGVEVSFVYGDPATGPVAYFLRFPVGHESPGHTHSSSYEAISLTEGWRHWLTGQTEEAATVHPAGTFVHQPADQPHHDVCVGPDPCVFFLYMPGKFDFFPMVDAQPVTDVGSYRVVRPADRSFVPILNDVPNGPKVAVVNGNPATGPLSYFLELPSGWNSGLHTHTSDYHAVAVSTDSRHWLIDEDSAVAPLLAPGTYWFQPSTLPHGDACDAGTACLAFLFMPGPIDFLPYME